MSTGLVCKNSLFKHINTRETFSKLCASHALPAASHRNSSAEVLCCSTFQSVADVYAPAVVSASGQCLYQADPRLFSCASYNANDVIRLCPCWSRSHLYVEQHPFVT